MDLQVDHQMDLQMDLEIQSPPVKDPPVATEEPPVAVSEFV